MKRLFFLTLLFVTSLAQAQQSISLTADALSGLEVLTPVLTWSTAPAADSCTASGGWFGAKGPAGTEILPSITVNTTYSLSCDWIDTRIELGWTAPINNTDGTPYIDPQGYNAYQGSAPGGPYTDASYAIIDPAVTTLVIDPLSIGTYCFVVTALNLANVESDLSNEACKSLGFLTNQTAIDLTVGKKPATPTNVTIQ